MILTGLCLYTNMYTVFAQETVPWEIRGRERRVSTDDAGTAAGSAVEQLPAAARRKATAAGAIGNGVEWFDYGLYGYFAATIGVVFFPSEDPTVSLLAAFAAFAVTFFVRPLGGFVFGPMGDRIGRRPTLATVVLLMSGATFLIAFLPGYAQIGIAAPILLVVLRLLQGLSAGGEAGGAATFLAEYAPPRRRAFHCSWLNISAFVGAFAGAGLSLLIAAVFAEEALNSWAWRIPFLVAGPLGLIGLYLRLKIEDSPEFQLLETEGEVSSAPLADMVRGNVVALILCGGIATTWGVGYYMILSFLPNYLSGTAGFSQAGAFLCTSIALLTAIIVLPITAYAADRIGRKPLVIAACAGYIVLAYPAFVLMSQETLLMAIISHVLLGIMLGTYGGAPFMAMVELFTTKVRYSAYSVAYNVALAILGGTAPFISTFLVASTGNGLAPAFYLMFAAAISFLSILFVEDKAGEPLKLS